MNTVLTRAPHRMSAAETATCENAPRRRDIGWRRRDIGWR